eukprot:178515-Alexandrium_andersonii.AAC.1
MGGAQPYPRTVVGPKTMPRSRATWHNGLEGKNHGGGAYRGPLTHTRGDQPMDEDPGIAVEGYCAVSTTHCGQQLAPGAKGVL